MYRFILLLIVFISLSSGLVAQHRWAFGLDLEVGVTGKRENGPGPTSIIDFTSAFSMATIERRNRPGGSVGLWSEYLTGRHFGVRLGVNYAYLWAYTQYETFVFTGAGVFNSYETLRINHFQSQLRMPLEIKWYPGRTDRKLKPFAGIGMQGVYALRQNNFSKSTLQIAGDPQTYGVWRKESADLTIPHTSFKRFRVGSIVGLGITTGHYMVSLHRTWSIINRKKEHNARFRECCSSIGCNCFVSTGGGTMSNLNLTSLRIAYYLY